MRNIGIIIAAVVIIVALGVGGVLFLKYSQPPAMTNDEAMSSTKAPAANSTTGTILSLLSGGKTVTCVFTSSDKKETGTVFVADKKFAGDYTSTDNNGKQTTGHMVSDGINVYVWGSALTNGFKMSLTATKNAVQGAQSAQSVNLNQNVDLKCSPWVADNSKFTIPTNIEFTDITQIMQQAAPSVTPQGGTQTGASPCDQIPAGAAKTACENALQSSGQ
jgi:hypothetical protein